MLFTFGALFVYAIAAMTTVFLRRRKLRRQFKILTENQEPHNIAEPDWDYYNKAANGRVGVQHAAYVFHIMLLVGAVLAIGGIQFGLTLLWLFLLVGLTPIVLIVDAFWIYSKKLNKAEQAAFVLQVDSSRLRAQHIVAWIAWVVYTFVAGVIFYSNLTV